MSTTDVLAELEDRVGAKYTSAVAARIEDSLRSIPECSWSDWAETAPQPLPPGTLQFPREQWVSYPAARTAALITAERLLDFADTMTQDHWAALHLVMLYGGKTRIA